MFTVFQAPRTDEWDVALTSGLHTLTKCAKCVPSEPEADRLGQVTEQRGQKWGAGTSLAVEGYMEQSLTKGKPEGTNKRSRKRADADAVVPSPQLMSLLYGPLCSG